MTDCYPEDQQVYLQKNQLHMGAFWSQHHLQGLSISLHTHLLIMTLLPAARHCQSHRWEVLVFLHKQGPSPAAWCWYLVPGIQHNENSPIFPFQPFWFTLLVTFLLSQPFPARRIRHPTRCILQCHKGTPKWLSSLCAYVRKSSAIPEPQNSSDPKNLLDAATGLMLNAL